MAGLRDVYFPANPSRTELYCCILIDDLRSKIGGNRARALGYTTAAAWKRAGFLEHYSQPLVTIYVKGFLCIPEKEEVGDGWTI